MATASLQARKNVPVRLWIPIEKVEYSAIEQLRQVSDLRWCHSHVAAMPDVHAGSGSTIGTVLALDHAVCPAAVGVDIGCGMLAARLNLDLGKLRRSRLERILAEFIDRIPLAHNGHNQVTREVRRDPLWERFGQLHREVQGVRDRAMAQLGTLGGGNHFIELTRDEQDRVWVTIHSGSRNIGKQLADQHCRVAKKLPCNKTHLPSKNLACFEAGTPEYDAYLHDMLWAQDYAKANRNRMLDLALDGLVAVYPGCRVEDQFDCHHNFATVQDDGVCIIRKGAVEAQVGQRALLPGAMGRASFVVEGLGNPEAFYSAPHGAGRKMSRKQARTRYSRDELFETLNHVVHNSTASTIDEICHAYKDVDDVVEQAAELCRPVHRLEPLLNVKG